MFDYETLRLIWWLIIGVILIGFAVSDGFDMGVGTLLPFIAANDTEKRILLNSVGPHWEGNQVWLILAGGRCLPRGLWCTPQRSPVFMLP